ncbi:transcription activator [Actinidia rufa]|uniref:Transcription activator n=1 Tax=Actinidia rufa TaxID=165716 RepID=A0A7J0DZS2_9ERIC|nr:transcription activator [Actinidia rufa]
MHGLEIVIVHCLQFLIYEVVSGGNLRKPGGLFGNSGSEIPVNDLKQLETFFYKLSFFLHILDYSETVTTLTDLGFLWFREFYLESSRVIQFPIECSLPWMLVDHVIESRNAGLLESVLMPFDIYNDSAQQALAVLKQRFLYDEIEAELDHCFDIFVWKLCETIFTYYKSWAASELLDPSFLFALDNGEKFSVQPMRLTALLKMTRVKLLGRTINLRSLISERMNKVFRENIEFLFDRFESQDLCAIVELEKLLNILQLAHQLLSRDLTIDAFSLMLNEMHENISLISYSGRLASQVSCQMLEKDLTLIHQLEGITAIQTKMMKLLEVAHTGAGDIIEATERAEKIAGAGGVPCRVRRSLEEVTWGSKDFMALQRGDMAAHPSYMLKDGFFFKGLKLSVPSCSLRDQLLAKQYNLGHFGKDKTLALLQGEYYWPGMKRDVANMCKCVKYAKEVLYGLRPPSVVDLVPLPISSKGSAKAEDMAEFMQGIHAQVKAQNEKSNA